MIVAWFALLTWPVLALIFFRTMSQPAALTLTIVGGYLLLPEQVHYKVPGLPAFGKGTITLLAAFVGSAIGRPSEGPRGFLPRSLMGIVLLGLLMVGIIGTHMTNGNPIFLERRVLPPLPISDIPVSLIELLVLMLPFLLARRHLATEEAQASALKVFVGLGVFYSLLALFEIRMSPQLNNWIYGFFPHSFAQHIRGSGFRPLVFLNHGLWLSIFMAMATLAAIGLSKAAKDGQQKLIYAVIAFWLYMTLFLTKSLGAFLITTLLTTGWLFLPRHILKVGLVSCLIIVLTYPVLRTLDLVPVDKAVSLAQAIDEDRAGSLEFRVLNENALLDHARARPIFGWGLFGRNLAVEIEGIRGGVVPDGYWVIAIGKGGYFQYFSEFGLMALGALALLFRGGLGPMTLTMIVLLTANMIDLLPNATLTTVTWLFAGALAGRLEYGARNTSSAPEPLTNPDRRVTLSRFPVSDSKTPAYRRDFSKERAGS